MMTPLCTVWRQEHQSETSHTYNKTGSHGANVNNVDNSKPDDNLSE